MASIKQITASKAQTGVTGPSPAHIQVETSQDRPGILDGYLTSNSQEELGEELSLQTQTVDADLLLPIPTCVSVLRKPSDHGKNSQNMCWCLATPLGESAKVSVWSSPPPGEMDESTFSSWVKESWPIFLKKYENIGTICANKDAKRTRKYRFEPYMRKTSLDIAIRNRILMFDFQRSRAETILSSCNEVKCLLEEKKHFCVPLPLAVKIKNCINVIASKTDSWLGECVKVASSIDTIDSSDSDDTGSIISDVVAPSASSSWDYDYACVDSRYKDFDEEFLGNFPEETLGLTDEELRKGKPEVGNDKSLEDA